ncbi:MAG: SPOR domain-containing protein [Bacteroidota bacterium]
MTSTTLWLLIRWMGSLLIGSFLVYRFRTIIRTAIGWCFPISKRMQPNFFNRMRRYTTIASLFLALLFMLLFNLTYQHFYPDEERSLQTQSLQTLPLLELPEKDVVPEETPSADQDSLADIPTVPVSAVSKNQPISYANETIVPAQTCYLQVGAFERLDYAQEHLRNWKNRTRLSVALATVPDHAPYKVLLGPFDYLDAARHHQRQYRIRAFPQPASRYHSIQFLED